MSKRYKKHRNSPGATGERATARPQTGVCTRADTDGLFAAGARVRELIAAQHSKAALELAKELHKCYAVSGSESLLIEAYEARIRDLLKHGMSAEANSLVNLVIQRFPWAQGRLDEIFLEVRMYEGNLDEFVASLEDPNLAPALREKIETGLRQRVWDLRVLSRVSSLPPSHALREGAAALIAALQAVTSAPADEADLLLPQVSRRSPLASWKALVHAIAAFYRRDDTTCRRWLQAIAPDSVPTRLVPVMQAMLGSGTAPVLSSAARKLVAAIGAGGEVLRPALASLESALAAKKRQPILEKARAAVSACECFRPDLCEKLRQYISIRCMLRNFAPDEVRDAIGWFSRTDAQWHHLLAKAMETTYSFEGLGHALIAWEAFRERALEQKLFAANAVEDGVLSLHMAELAARIPADVADDLLWLVGRQNRPRSKGGLTPRQLLFTDALYQRACAADPHSDAFQSWLAWAKKQRDWRIADRVAESWHQSRGQDVAPLLWLMESSEKRSAYQKSLKYLEQAEQLDRLNPEVRKAKLRLLLAGVLRHLRQHKPHLASQGIERIEASADLDGGLVALVSALRRVCAALDKDSVAVDQHAAEVEARLGSCVAAYVLHRGIADAAVLAPEETLLDPLVTKSYDGMTLLKGLAKACVLDDSVGIPLAVPEEWEDRLTAALIAPHPALRTAELLVLGEAAIRSQASNLAFAVSVAGLVSGGADSRFLFLRARALPAWASEKRYDCLSAALELARRERNTDLTGKLLDELRCCPNNMFAPDDFVDDVGPDSHSMEPGFLNEILACERAAKQFPIPGGNLPARDECDEADIFPDEKDFADSEDVLAKMPPELARELTKAIARGAQPEEILKGTLPGRSGTAELEDLFALLAPELLREIKKAMALGVTPDEILEEMEDVLAGDFLKGRFHRGVQKKEKPGAVRPQQGSLF